jgi:hypothetical protein
MTVVTAEPDPQHPLNQLWLEYVRQCIQPSLDYMVRQEAGRLREPLALYSAARMFNPGLCKGYVT